MSLPGNDWLTLNIFVALNFKDESSSVDEKLALVSEELEPFSSGLVKIHVSILTG